MITVPSIIEMLLSADALNVPSLSMIGYGGSPIHPDTMRRLAELRSDVDFVNLFGQTEGSPLTVLGPRDHRAAISGNEQLLRSVGRAAPGVELRIADPGPDGIGEVWAGFKVPAEWRFVPSLPCNPVGKPLRRKLTESYDEQLTQGRGPAT